MKTPAWAAAALGVVALSASAAGAQVLNPGDYSSSPDRGYVSSTVQTAEFDIALSRIAAEQCPAAPIKAMAAQVVADQTQAEAATQAAAAESNAAPNRVPVLNAYQAELLVKLRQAGPDRCATVYLGAEEDSFRQAVALQQGFAKQGVAPALRRAALHNADQAQAHLDTLRRLEP